MGKRRVFKIVFHILVLLSLSQFSYQRICDSDGSCAPFRPRNSTGCCPLQAGEKCGADQTAQCDTELGYTCVHGICTGRYNLTVVRMGDTSLTLAWTPYLQDGPDIYDYTVLYSTSLTEPTQLSNSHLAGKSNNYTVQWLLPDTWYYFQIAAWNGQSYGNLSEIILVKTKAKDYCLFNGRHIKKGERIVVECEEVCLCAGTGRFECVPVCSSREPDLVVCSENTTSLNCCQRIPACSPESCTYQGRTLDHGHSWAIDCEETCTCLNGVVTCNPLCEDIIPPENCTDPILTKTLDGCCERYFCNETDLQSTVQNHSDAKFDTLSMTPTLTVVNMSSASALLTWSIPEPLVYDIASFLIKYKPLSAPDWQYTPRLIFTERMYRLQCLHHFRWYDVHLLAYPGKRRLATAFFNTTGITESSDKEQVLGFQNVTMLTDSVVVTWKPISSESRRNITHIEIMWTSASGGHDDAELKACVPPAQDSYTIKDLEASTMYTIWLGVYLHDGTAAVTNRMHVVTARNEIQAETVSKTSLAVAIVIACTSFAAFSIAITTLLYIFKFRRRASYIEHNHFENRIFQIYNSQDERVV